MIGEMETRAVIQIGTAPPLFAILAKNDNNRLLPTFRWFFLSKFEYMPMKRNNISMLKKYKTKNGFPRKERAKKKLVGIESQGLLIRKLNWQIRMKKPKYSIIISPLAISELRVYQLAVAIKPQPYSDDSMRFDIL